MKPWALTVALAAALSAGCDGTSSDKPDAGSDDAGPPDGAGPECTEGTGAFPRPLELPGAEPNGVFDPNLAYDPASGRLWITYSGVTGPAGSGLVSTHLAYSDDGGDSWCEAGIVNPAAVVPVDDQPADKAQPDAHWSHEVSALAVDPGAPPEARWRLIWHRYLHIDDGNAATDDRHFEHGWIAQRRAATPEELLTAEETKLFSGLAYHVDSSVEAYNDSVAGGKPDKRFDQDPDLGSCLAFSEPGLLAHAGTLYVAMFCYRGATEQDIVLVRLSHTTGEWSYAGTLLDVADAQAINPALENFNGADLFATGDEHRLVITPAAGGAYLGCLTYELDLAQGTLPTKVALHGIEKTPDPAVFQTGACAYHEQSGTGMIVGDTFLSGVQFRLVATGETL